MKALVMFMGCVAGSAPALGQAQKGEARPAATITLAELQGTTIEMKFERAQIVMREDKIYPVQIKADLKVVLGPADRIKWVIGNTIETPRGVQRTEPKAFSGRLEEPGETKFFGSGHGVWIFSQGILTTLRTYPTGAFKREIKFARSGSGLECAATEGVAREDGTGGVVMTATDGVPVTIVSEKLVSSSCRVTKGK